MSRQFIVLGMHRSYTTLIASWLHANGIPMFDATQPTPLYYEDPAFFNIHESFLESQGLNWLNARPPYTEPTGIFRESCKALIAQRNTQHEFWGWKDPRTCVLYEFLWAPLTAEAKFIIVFRDPSAVADSLFVRTRKRGTKSRITPNFIYRWKLDFLRTQYHLEYHKCWNRYNQCLVNLIHSEDPSNFIVVNFDSLKNKEALIRKTFQSGWGVALKGPSLKDLMQTSTIPPSNPGITINAEIREETSRILAALNSALSFQ